METPAGIADADAIAAVDGVDMIALGANDLTAELGIPGQFDHQLVREAVAAVATACRNHGKLLMLAGIADRATYTVPREPRVPVRSTSPGWTPTSSSPPRSPGWRPDRPGARQRHDLVPLQRPRCATAETQHPSRLRRAPGSCDAHFHVFEPGYRSVAEPLYTFPDATLEQYLQLTEVLGISRMVLVQPSFYGVDNTPDPRGPAPSRSTVPSRRPGARTT